MILMTMRLLLIADIFAKAKLPKWFGERPGKKTGDPESPEEDEDAANEAAAEEDVADTEFEEE